MAMHELSMEGFIGLAMPPLLYAYWILATGAAVVSLLPCAKTTTFRFGSDIVLLPCWLGAICEVGSLCAERQSFCLHAEARRGTRSRRFVWVL